MTSTLEQVDVRPKDGRLDSVTICLIQNGITGSLNTSKCIDHQNVSFSQSVLVFMSVITVKCSGHELFKVVLLKLYMLKMTCISSFSLNI